MMQEFVKATIPTKQMISHIVLFVDVCYRNKDGWKDCKIQIKLIKMKEYFWFG